MAKSDNFELDGIVKKALPGAKFEVEVDAGNGKTSTAISTTTTSRVIR